MPAMSQASSSGPGSGLRTGRESPLIVHALLWAAAAGTFAEVALRKSRFNGQTIVKWTGGILIAVAMLVACGAAEPTAAPAPSPPTATTVTMARQARQDSREQMETQVSLVGT